MKNTDRLEIVTDKLRWLRLPGMAATLDDLLAEATKKNLTPTDVVDRLCDEEKASRLRRAVDRRIQQARFPEVNTVDAFDFDYDPTRKKLKARYLALGDMNVRTMPPRWITVLR